MFAAAARDIDIPAGPADVSLYTLARELHLQILYQVKDLAGIQTHAVKGTLQPREALLQLLAGTGLTVKSITPENFVVSLGEHPDSDAPEDNTKETTPQQPVERPNASDRLAYKEGADGGGRPAILIQGHGVRGKVTNLPEVDPITFSREYIEESGFATVADLLATLPQNFGGGPNENTSRGGGAETNSGSGSGVNLRGLSDGGTIILLNGRRLAPSGTVGGFTDIANIPLSAIDYMEVFPEGATARYGVDAIGGIVNFVLRQDVGMEAGVQIGGLAKSEASLERFDQSIGTRWGTGNVFAALEYYQRDALPSDRRRLATSNLEPFGGQNFATPYSNPGTLEASTLTGAAVLWAIPYGQNGKGLLPGRFTPNTINLHDTLEDATILPRQQLISLVVTGQQKIARSSVLFLDVILSHRQVQSTEGGESFPVRVGSGSPFFVNPTGTLAPVTVLYNFGRDLGPIITHTRIDSGQVTAGLDIEDGLFDHIEFHASYAFERQHQLQDNLVDPNAVESYANDTDATAALNVFGDGSFTDPHTLAAIRAQGMLTLDSRLFSGEMSADQGLVKLPGGDLLLSLTNEYRRQALESAVSSPTSYGVIPTDLSRTTLATFAQITVPLVGAGNRISGIDALTLTSAIRYEHYSDVGAVTSPQYAIAYHPIRQLLLRGTWSELGHAPDLPDLSEANNVSFLYPLQSPLQQRTTALIVSGSNSALAAEHAVTWTAGFTLTPLEIPELQLGSTYFNTRFVGRIASPFTFPANVLLDPSLSWLLAPVNPSMRANICSHSQFAGGLSSCLQAPIGAIVDLRLRNIGRLDTRGVDVAARYELRRHSGIWNLALDATYLFQYAQKQTPSSPELDLLNTDHNPIDLRLRTSLSWRLGEWWTRATINFQNSYKDIDSTPNRSISSWTTVDAAIGYDLHLGDCASQDRTRLSLSVQNVFNHQPPFLNSQYGIGYDQENASLRGRSITFSVRQRW